MLLNLFYDLSLAALALITLPRLFYQMLFHKKYRKSLLHRLGIGFPRISKQGKRLVWVHAVSVGETRAVSALVKKMKKENPNTLVVVSNVTETGHDESLRSIPEADYHVFLPFDFKWIIRPILQRASPESVIICETDFWFNFLKCSKNLGAKIFLVNGKLSQRSLERYRKFHRFSQKLFSLIDYFCVQSPHYEERFCQLGIEKGKMAVTGNIKFDGSYPQMPREEIHEWKQSLGIDKEDLVFVAGSTHDPEEKLILQSLENVWKKIDHIKILLVPRHPERFDEVARMLDQQGIPYQRYSQRDGSKPREKVVLVDAMGVLTKCYQIADLALVAGSYTQNVGGHNILEPSWYGVPVIFGPFMHSQPELVELINHYQAGVQVDSLDLSEVLLRLFKDPNARKALGDAGMRMVHDLGGATEKTYRIIFSENNKNPC